jgi:signal transduction histidine kinase/DNA-binding NarL/FixJ family response regulator
MMDLRRHGENPPRDEEEGAEKPQVAASADRRAGPRLAAIYPIGAEIECRVSRVLPVGVEAHPVEAPEVRAFVHRHEWTWLRRIIELSDHAHAGDPFKGRVQGYRRRSLILSRKRCLPDPFEEFKRTHRPGDGVEGRFSLLLNNDAGIRLEIGAGESAVEGFVPRSELPPVALDLDGFGLLAGDLLAARILRFEADAVVLSVRDQLGRRDAWIVGTENRDLTTLQHHPVVGLTLERLYYQQRLAEAPGLFPGARVREEIQRILLIEDEEAVATSLSDALIRAGFMVETGDGGARTLETLQAAPVDLLVLDRNLQGAEGTDLLNEPGVLAATRFVCILTGTPSPEVYTWHTELAAAGRLLVLDKPTPPNVLFARLDALLSREGPPPAQPTIGLAPHLPDEDVQISRWLAHPFGHPEKLASLLADLRSRLGADYACVLAYEEGPRFRLVAGNFVALTRGVQQNLEMSPVGTTVREHRYIYHSPIGETARNEYRHLREVIPAGAFAGFGIAYSDQARYGVFLINEGTRPLPPFSPEDRSLWELRITQHLIEERFTAALVENQTLLLKGLLTSALLHEVGNRLQTLADHSALQVDVAREIESANRQLNEAQLVDLLKSTEGVRGSAKDLEDLVNTFRNLFGGTDAPERVRVDHLLESLERAFRSMANREALRVRVEIREKIPAVTLNPKLLEQPILNLLLNAKEQMALRGSAVRRIWLVAGITADARFPVEIRVRDTGPGIHALDRDRIFNLFFTTKPKGTGLGLFIARLLVERFGGELRLDRSLLFEGSEFCIKLPMAVIS